uniref:Uncharacterized protein n=1 Tax=Arundo donax TaxID=35708 RepID=A0A0A9SM75_ARUDO
MQSSSEQSGEDGCKDRRPENEARYCCGLTPGA